MTVILYETPSSLLAIGHWDEVAWSPQGVDRTPLKGRFAEHAEAWTNGDWEPTEADGWHPTNVDDLKLIAEWDSIHGVTIQNRRHELGEAAQDYLPSLIVKSFTYTRDYANPARGSDIITITASGTKVTEEHTIDGVTYSELRSRSFTDEFDVEMHLRRRDLDFAREGYEGLPN